MGRCKRHAADLSSTAGVCASCLRERLFAVIAAQAQKQRQSQQSPSDQRLDFPRSVSPYISRRRSEASATWQKVDGRGPRFYSTPQVGPTGSATMEVREKRGGKTKLSSLFSSIFRSRPDSSRGWLSGVFSTRREKSVSTAFPLDKGSTVCRQPTRVINNKGLSPARCSFDEEGEDDDGDGSSGKSSESSRRPTTPPNASATRRRTASAASNGRNPSSGFAFCLSPLVRASPNRRNWSSELAVAAGECRAVPRLSKPASFCKSRSRKIADFGRSNR